MLSRYPNIDLHVAHITLAGQRPRSVACRRRVLVLFARSIAPAMPLDATRADIEMFLGRPLDAHPLAARTRRAYLAHLRGFYRWALDNDLIATDPTAKVPSVKIPRGVPRPVSGPDLADALAGADRRMRAWLLLMALGGLRACEVSVLRPEDMWMDPPMLFLRETKGGGSATVPAHPLIVEALACLPVDGRGAWWSSAPNYVTFLVSQHLRSLGISATGHQLRHWFGTAAYEASGHDLLATKRLLRHATVASTEVYADIDVTRPAEVVRLVAIPSQRTPGPEAA